MLWKKKTIWIKMHDGMIKTLTNVWHVLNLNRNLIFLGTLKPLRCKYTIVGGVLKVSEGTPVLIGVNTSGSLYLLQGSTIIGSATFIIHVRFWCYKIIAFASWPYEWQKNGCFEQETYLMWPKVLVRWNFVNILFLLNKNGLVSLLAFLEQRMLSLVFIFLSLGPLLFSL